MKVKTLIRKLEKLDPDGVVWFRAGGVLVLPRDKTKKKRKK